MPEAARRVLILVVLLLLAACTRVDDSDSSATSNAIVVGGDDDDGYHGAFLGDSAYAVPDLPLVDTDGEKQTLARPPAPLTLVFFGYTHCPDICQIQMATIASALTRLDPTQRKQVGVAFVTTDPARDTEEVLRDYLDQFDPGFVGLTGDLDTIVTVGEDLGVYIDQGQELPDGGYEVDHSTPIIVVDDDARAPLVWTQGASSAEIAEDIDRLLTDRAS